MSESLNPLPFPVQIDPDALGRVVVLMGGHSSERNVSLDSGRNVLKALQAKGVNAEAFDPAEQSLGDLEKAGYDRAFIALHGRYGEDGTIQGVLEMLGIPYTGSGVMASAVAIDKISTKQMWQAGRLPTPPWEVLLGPHQLAGLAERLGLPLIIKPPHEGSTLGLTRVDSLDRLPAAYERAADIDFPVLAERFVQGRELTVAVIGSGAAARALPQQVFHRRHALPVPRTARSGHGGRHRVAGRGGLPGRGLRGLGACRHHAGRRHAAALAAGGEHVAGHDRPLAGAHGGSCRRHLV